MRKETWFSIDIETNGPIPGAYDLVSIGACVIGEDKRVFYAELKPHGGMTDPEAQAIHGLTREHLLANGVHAGMAINSFIGWVKVVAGKTRPVFCSWGTFDWMWMGWYFETYGKRYTYPFGPNSVDLKSYYMGLAEATNFSVCQKRNMPSDDLRGKHTHNALEDAMEQAEMAAYWQEKYRNE